MHSVLIKRHRNNDELQMKLVLPKIPLNIEAANALHYQQTLLNVDLIAHSKANRLLSASTQMSNEQIS